MHSRARKVFCLDGSDDAGKCIPFLGWGLFMSAGQVAAEGKDVRLAFWGVHDCIINDFFTTVFYFQFLIYKVFILLLLPCVDSLQRDIDITHIRCAYQFISLLQQLLQWKHATFAISKGINFHSSISISLIFAFDSILANINKFNCQLNQEKMERREVKTCIIIRSNCYPEILKSNYCQKILWECTDKKYNNAKICNIDWEW